MWGVAGNDHLRNLVRRHPDLFLRCAVENVSLSGASRVMERELEAGAIGIGELKNKVACDSSEMQRIAGVARDYDVPMLIHFQDGAYNDGYVRFHRMLEKYPTVKFIGHAQTFWANIDKNYKEADGSYPKDAVVPGGLTDRWLADYPNLYGDLSAGSGNNALVRDPSFTKGFLARHQDKLMYGSDCYCPTGVGPQCLGATKQLLLGKSAQDESILKKVFFGNARKLYRIPAAHLE
ncbi:MAG: amidohydrolase family protein [Opitutaceae bacterium]